MNAGAGRIATSETSEPVARDVSTVCGRGNASGVRQHSPHVLPCCTTDVLTGCASRGWQQLGAFFAAAGWASLRFGTQQPQQCDAGRAVLTIRPTAKTVVRHVRSADLPM